MDSSSCLSISARRLLELTDPSVQLLSCRCRTLQTLSEYDGLAREPISGCVVHAAIDVLRGCLSFVSQLNGCRYVR
jgi:hypothetical protein